MKLLLAFLGFAAIALAGAVFLVVWISGQTPIHVTESATLRSSPPDAQELVNQGAMLLVHGEIDTVHEAEWNTSDGSRPSTPWDVSSVPDTYWIQTPVTIDLIEPAWILRPDDVAALGADPEANDLTFLVRGGEVDRDRVEVDDGLDREFEAGENVLLVLIEADADSSTDYAWELVRKYTVSADGTAELVWGEDGYENPANEVIEEYRRASR